MQRDISLDSMRGLLVLYITAGHLMMTTFTGFKGLQSALLYPFGYFQVITAFVFVSGLVVGKVSYHLLAKRGMGVIVRGTRDRVLTIYFAHLLVVVWVAVLLQFFPQILINSRLLPFQQDFIPALIKGALLLIQPSFVDILPVYLFASLLVPSLLWLMRRGQTALALIISFGMWLYGQTEPQLALQQNLAAQVYLDLGRFEFFSWQSVFVIAVVVSYHSQNKTNRWMSTGIYPLTWLAVGITVFLLAVRWDVIDIKGFPPRHWINLRALSWFCMLNFLCVAYVVYRMVARWPHLFQWPWLSFLGRHGIWVFSYHCIVVFALLIVKAQVLAAPTLMQVLLFLGCLMSLYIPAYFHERYQVRRRQTQAN